MRQLRIRHRFSRPPRCVNNYSPTSDIAAHVPCEELLICRKLDPLNIFTSSTECFEFSAANVAKNFQARGAPTSPIMQAVSIGRARYRIVAASADLAG